MTEISMDFDGLRLSALRKAIQISDTVDGATIGPNATKNDVITSSENIENSKNTCNRESPTKPSKSRNCPVFSVEKLRHENEIQRREEVQKAIDKRKHDMALFENGLKKKMELIRNKLVKTREREMEAERIRIEAEEERFAQQDELKQRHEAQLQAQRLQERKEKLEREAIELRKSKEHQDCLIKITRIKSNFTEKCKEIAQLAKSIKNKNLVTQIIGQFTTKLRELSQQIDAIIEFGRTNNLTINNINEIDDIINQTDEIYEICKVEVTKANEIYDEIVRREEELKLKNQESVNTNNSNNSLINTGKCEIANPDTPPNELIENNSESSSTETIDDGSNENYFYQIYSNSVKFLDQYQTAYNDFVNSNATMKFQNECNKAVNFLTKKIAPTSGQHLREVFNDFVMLFESKKPPFVNQYSQGLAFCKNLVAQIFIEQVEDSFVRRNTKWIYALAAITVNLWAEYPDVGELILAHLRMNCPYIVPVLLPCYQGQNIEDFYKSRGYKYTDGVRENEDEFIQRMSNLVKFYAAIIVTNISASINKPHPHGIGYAWRWMAGILNSQPQHDAVKIYARVLKDMLEICGNAMWKNYPTQFPKLLMVLAQDYYPLLQRYEGDSNFAMSPLRDFLNDAITNRSIPPPDGQLPPNFW